MNRFENEATEQIYHTRFAPGVPKHVCVAAHEIMRILIAARSLQDVGVLGCILRWRNLPGRYGLQIDGKWNVTFTWNNTFGATAIRLERRKE